MGAVLYPRLNRGLDFPRESMVAKQGAETKQSSPKQTNKSERGRRARPGRQPVQATLAVAVHSLGAVNRSRRGVLTSGTDLMCQTWTPDIDTSPAY